MSTALSRPIVQPTRPTVVDGVWLPAVGRGGVLDLATRYAPEACVSLESVHRFTDPAYADLSLRMRRGASAGAVFDALLGGGEVVVHATEVERMCSLAATGSRPDAPLVIADTREQVAQLNALIHDVRVATREVMPGVVTRAGEKIGVGDRIATRRNDPDLDVANRETWTVTRHGGRQPDCERAHRHTQPPGRLRP